MHAPLHKLPVKVPERPRARRERRSAAVRAPVLHVVMPGLEVAQAVPRSRETVTAFLRRTGWAHRDRQYGWQFRKGLPTVLEINGECVLRKRWSTTRIAANDNVRFVSYPLGGGKGGMKQVVGLVALVALAAFSGGIATALLGSSLAGTAVLGSLTAGQILAGGLVIGGSLLISALTAPKPGATNDPNAAVDQIYTAQAQGNLARLGQPLPVWYGRNNAYPDFAASPWGEFVGNDQYVNVLLSVSVGRMSYEQLLIDDTPMWNPTDGVLPAFSSAQIAFYEPGETVTLFPVNVSQAAEVTGQEIPAGGGSFDSGDPSPGAWVGGFIAAPSGTLAQAIAIDFVFPAGCFKTDDENGNTIATTIGITAEYRYVDDAGAPTGLWATLFTTTRGYASRSPIRDTIKVGVSPGRYEVRFRREDGEVADNKGASKIVWAGLRSFLAGSNSFADVSTIAIRIKATESTQGSFKFGVIGTRILPVWDVDSGVFIEQPTRNPHWAALDVATNGQYGAGHPLSKVDFNAWVNQAAAADSRSDRFDFIFTSAEAVPDSIDKALTVTRSKHFWLGDSLSVVRDEWRDVPTMMLTDREIVRDSVQVQATMLGEEDPDAVIIEYVDENTWRPAQVQYPPETGAGGFHAFSAEPKRINGIQNRDHAYREAAFYYLVSIYRRELTQIQTEYEGRAITFGSVLRVQSELPQDYGYSGAVVGRADRELTLSPAPTWDDSAQNYIRLRRPNGKSFGPIKVSKGGTDDAAVLDAADLAAVQTQQSITLDAVLARVDGGEDPSFELGTADNQSKLAMVLGGQPNGDLCTLNLVVDDERVHATDIGTPPILPSPQYPTNPRAPLIAGLNAMFTQGVAEPLLAASWFPAPGALYYRADVSFDHGASWLQVYEGLDNQFSTFVTLAALTVRVQAIGNLSGPYSTVELDAPSIVLGKIVALASLVEALHQRVTAAVGFVIDEANRFKQFTGSMGLNRAAAADMDIRQTRRDLASATNRAKARIEEVWTAASSDIEALASVVTTLESTIEDPVTGLGATAEAVDGLLTIVNDTDTGLSATAQRVTNLTTTINGQTAELTVLASSVDGVMVQFGVVGHLDGVTGGLVLTGVRRLDGSVSYDLYIQANVNVLGKFTGSQIDVGTINTINLAVNSVSIENLIAGSASKVGFASVDLHSQGSSNSIASFEIKSDAVIVQLYLDIDLWGDGQRNLIINLSFAGAAIKTWTWSYPEDSTSTIAGQVYNHRLRGPYTAFALITGRNGATGNITVSRGGDSGDQNGTVSGTLLVQDLRR